MIKRFEQIYKIIRLVTEMARWNFSITK